MRNDLKINGFVTRTDNSLLKEYDETIVMIQLKTSAYDTVDYYLNMGCIVKRLNGCISPLFDRDRMNWIRIEDKGNYQKCFEDVLFYCQCFSSIEKLREETMRNKVLYNMTTPRLLQLLIGKVDN